MFLINEPLIKTINLTDENVVMVVWESYWYQEDTDELTKIVFDILGGVTTTENIRGADRTNVRFVYKAGNFLLNFECYSQSCWLEAEDELSRDFLVEIVKGMSSHT